MQEIVLCPNCAKLVFSTASGHCPDCGGVIPPGAQNPVTAQAEQGPPSRTMEDVLNELTPYTIVTPAIVAINVLVFIVMVIRGVGLLSPDAQDVLNWGANYGPRTMQGEWWRLLTSMFLHFGLIHLGFNMWVLSDAGRLVERLVGNTGFLLLYLFSGVMGSLTSLFWRSDVISAGASGAVFGVIGALGGFVLLRRDTVPPHVLRHLRGSLGLFVIYNLIFGLAVPGIDLAAHLGGLFTGAACGLIMSRPLRPEGAFLGRAARNLLVLLLAAVAVPGALALLPAPPPDVDAVMNEFGDSETKIFATYDGIVDKMQRGELPTAEAADQIEQQVLIPWREQRQNLESLKSSSRLKQDVYGQLLEYTRLREDSFRLLIESLRENDEEKMSQHAAGWAAAEELARRLSQQNE